MKRKTLTKISILLSITVLTLSALFLNGCSVSTKNTEPAQEEEKSKDEGAKKKDSKKKDAKKKDTKKKDKNKKDDTKQADEAVSEEMTDDGDGSGFSEAEILSYLEGPWEIMDDGELIQEPGLQRDIMIFSVNGDHTMQFIRPNGEEAEFVFTLSDTFDDIKGTYDRITFENAAGGGKYAWEEVRSTQSFQVMIANNLGLDYLMLRELGDERTGFASDALRYDRSIQGLWMLRRPVPDDYDGAYETEPTTPSTVGSEEMLRLTDTSFYALKWMEFGNSCTLQLVDVINSGADTLAYSVPHEADAYSAVNYEYKDMQDMAHGGFFSPVLLKVTTDKDGQVIETEGFEYAGEGLYFDRAN